jgi:hypothetical protein
MLLANLLTTVNATTSNNGFWCPRLNCSHLEVVGGKLLVFTELPIAVCTVIEPPSLPATCFSSEKTS